tara:strand:- start:481 stop:864 length:384 start_codon:yes stop_codon:yes gene_type:complete
MKYDEINRSGYIDRGQSGFQDEELREGIKNLFEQYVFCCYQGASSLMITLDNQNSIEFDFNEDIRMKIGGIDCSDKLKELIMLDWKVNGLGGIEKKLTLKKFLNSEHTENFVRTLYVLESTSMRYEM